MRLSRSSYAWAGMFFGLAGCAGPTPYGAAPSPGPMPSNRFSGSQETSRLSNSPGAVTWATEARPATITAMPSSTALTVQYAALGLPHSTVHGPVGGSECAPDEARACEEIVRRELSRYPAELLQRARLQRVVLVQGLTFNGSAWAGVPDFASRTLYLEAVRGRGSPQYRERLMHHELYHLIDEASHGTIRNDPEFKALNPPSFSYGRTSSTVGLTNSHPGFITGYSRNAVEEDKAELFSCLMTMREETSRRAASDPVLSRKIELLKSRLEKFCPGSAATLFPN